MLYDKSSKREKEIPTIMEFSSYQLRIFENIASGTGHTVVNAVAGSGKTTVLVNGFSHIPAGLKTLFVAFNKKIADELKVRAPVGVEVSTLHSYGLKCVTNGLGRLRIDDHRVEDMARSILGDDAKTFDMRRDLAKTVSLAKGALAGDADQVDALIDAFGIESAKDGQRDGFIKNVLKILEQCTSTQDGRIDFDDMIWLPLVLNLRQRQFPRVMIDELQDFVPAQIELALRAVTSDGRILGCGDRSQAIYAFRGANENTFDNIKTRLNATELPLSICYRCCKAVVREAQEMVPHIEAAPDAIEGEVLDATVKEMERDAKPGDFILSRTNAPLISLCMNFLKAGRRAMIQGRDVGALLSSFVRKSKAPTVEALRDFVEAWRTKECERLAKKNRNTQAVEDKAECVLALSEGAGSVDDVAQRIESLFADADDKNSIVLSSTHKAKGLERDKVWMLRWTYLRRQETEDRNIYYVACTRARKTLVFVSKNER